MGNAAVLNNTSTSTAQNIWCYDPEDVSSNGYKVRNPLKFPAPLMVFQLSVISLTSLLIDAGLKPLGQPSLVAQVLGGIVFGPSVLGHLESVRETMFPTRGVMALETAATFGVLFNLFVIGVECDSKRMFRPGKKAIIIGVTVMFTSLGSTMALAMLIKHFIVLDPLLAKALPIVAASQCVIGFPNVCSLLKEMQLLNTDQGRLATSSAMFCDIIGLTLASVGFIKLQLEKEHTVAQKMGSILSPLILVIFTVFSIRPAIKTTLRLRPEGKPVGENYFVCVLILALLYILTAETIGQHYLFGSLVLGMAIPEGPPLGAALIRKLHYPVGKVLYPVFLTTSGLKTDIFTIHFKSLWVIALLVLFGVLVKIVIMMIITRYTGLTIQDSVILGLMLNARGICDVVFFNLWRVSQALSDEHFAVAIMLSVVSVMVVITPLIRFLIRALEQQAPTMRRTIQHSKPDSELRILVCVHDLQSVPTMVNLLEASNATEQSPVGVIALVLIELVGRAAPLLITHNHSQGAIPQDASISLQIINALRQYELAFESCVTLQPFIDITHYELMPEDISRLALDQNATIAILPFHKHWEIDGSIGTVSRAIQTINTKILRKAPCSVGILVDRGILKGSMATLSNQGNIYHVAVVYIGGPDDAESLAYGARMARHKNVSITIIRFLMFGYDNARERKLDNSLIEAVRYENSTNENFVYEEHVTRDGVGLSASLRGLENRFDLIVVGRHHEDSPLLVGLGAWSECPELGVVGDFLASADIGLTASILVVQQQRIRGKLMSRTMKPVVNNQDGQYPDMNNAINNGISTPRVSVSSDHPRWEITIDRTN
ncbi:cation/H(+) antiporter 15-like [Nicotiana tomentosiformis]|uniref:cation/H(+) antiporter 15-like n=1 Tax=Nicotiana tomentosiformis TaxID=4098 RepID=UPI00051BBD96|nr:cation/H(+) antiporter 15-like [Nicotiana tomentosiformis]